MEYKCCFGIVFFINIAIRAEAILVCCIHMDNHLSVAGCCLQCYGADHEPGERRR